MKPSNKIMVPKKNSGERLDIFLAKKLKISRSQVQKMIGAEQVFVNKKLPKKPGDNLTEGEVIEIKKAKLTVEDSTKKNAGQVKFDVNIIATTPDYVVVEKPVGMLSHPTMAEEKNTLANFIVKKYPQVKKVGDDPMRPGIVHRLDKEASGLMVIARTQKMFNHLKEQFKNRTIDKEYMVLAHEPMPRNWDEINFPISRSETSDRMAAIPTAEASRGKEAKTEFLVIKNFVNFSLIRVKIHTGRMHQIRVHLLAYNHPVVGDPLYFQKKQKRVWDDRLGRLFLHSTKLGFVDLAGEAQEFESPLPKELDEFLKLLK
jgi:23S rRNA pseudouridine1911/1915/1917 synthase